MPLDEVRTWLTGTMEMSGFLDVAQLGDRYRRYRLPDPDAEAAMAGSFQPLWTTLTSGGLSA